MTRFLYYIGCILFLARSATAFVSPIPHSGSIVSMAFRRGSVVSSAASTRALVTRAMTDVSIRTPTQLAATTEDKAAMLVTGEELELLLTEWEQPLVVDAYATWCGPCLLMAPEFESAAKELKGKVRFVKLDTDKEEKMAARLNIMGLPTLLFLDQYKPKEGEKDLGARALLKGRIEGAMRKQDILALCEYHFFAGPEPKMNF